MKRFALLFFLCLSLFVISASALGTGDIVTDDDGNEYTLLVTDDGTMLAVRELEDGMYGYSYTEDDGIMPLASTTTTYTAAGGKLTILVYSNGTLALGPYPYPSASSGSFDYQVASVLYEICTYYDSQLANVVSDTNLSQLVTLMQTNNSTLSTISSYLSTGNSTLSTISSRVSTTNTRLTTTNNYLNTANSLLVAIKGDIEDYFKISSSSDLFGSAGAGSGFLLQSTGEFMAAASLGTSGEWDIGQISANGFAGLGRILSTFSAHFDEYREDFSDYQQDFSGYRDEFNTVFPLFSGQLSQSSITGFSITSPSYSDMSVPALLAQMHNNLTSYLSSSPSLSSTGTNSTGSSSRSISYIASQGFLGLASLIRGASGAKYPFTFVSAADGMSTYLVTPGSLMESLQFGFQGVQNPLAKLQYVYADENDIEMKKDSEENSAAVTDNFIKPGSAGSVSVKDISDMSSVSSAVSGLTATGVSLGNGFAQIADEDVWSFFTQDVANDLDTVSAAVSDDDMPQYTDAYGANMAELYSILGLGGYEYSTAVEDEVDLIWAEIMGGGD